MVPLQDNRMWVTRAKVRTDDSTTFYLTHPDGTLPDQRKVQEVRRGD